MKAIMHLDNLVEECGWFTSATTVNNGYGCLHPEQEDREEEFPPTTPPTTCGRCFSFTCPIASELNPADEPEDAAEARAAGMDPTTMSEGAWMLVSITDGSVDGAAPRSAP